jgi:hypothetical protein
MRRKITVERKEAGLIGRFALEKHGLSLLSEIRKPATILRRSTDSDP